MTTTALPELKIARGFALPLDLVTEATAIVATRGAGKSSASAVIVEEAFAASVQAVVFDRTGVYWGLRSSAKGDGPGLPIYVLGGPHGDAPLEAHAGVLIADLVVDSGHSFVLDLSDLSKGQATRFAADFLERLYDRKANARTTLLLVMDEAHFYAPQTPRGGFKGDSAKLMGAMEDVVGLGRSRGLGVVLTTQRTQALNKAVLDLIETLLVMRMLSPRARQAVKDWIQEKHEDDEQGVIPTLDSLPTGTAWVWSPLRGILEKVALRRIKTYDSYATPKPGQARIEPTARRELDLAALGEQMAATAERAKENDPAELRKRLRDAEALLADLERHPPARPVGDPADLPAWENYFREDGWLPEAEQPDPAPVTVYTIGDLDAVWKLVTEAKATGDGLVEALGDVVRPLAAAILEATEAAERKTEAPAAPARRTAREERGTSRPEPTGNGSVGTSVVPAAVRPAGGTVDPELRISGPQQKVLDALAWFFSVGILTPKRSVVAAVARVSSKSSGFEKNLSTLRTAGLIGYPSGGRLELTAEGQNAASWPERAPTEAELHDLVCGMVSGPQGAILRVLVEAYPAALSRDEIAEKLGVSAASSGFEKNLSTLRSFELVDYPDRGFVAALPVLFFG